MPPFPYGDSLQASPPRRGHEKISTTQSLCFSTSCGVLIVDNPAVALPFVQDIDVLQCNEPVTLVSNTKVWHSPLSLAETIVPIAKVCDFIFSPVGTNVFLGLGGGDKDAIKGNHWASRTKLSTSKFDGGFAMLLKI